MKAHAPFSEHEEVPMPIVGGLDIHRKQLTFEGHCCVGRSRMAGDWSR